MGPKCLGVLRVTSGSEVAVSCNDGKDGKDACFAYSELLVLTV